MQVEAEEVKVEEDANADGADREVSRYRLLHQIMGILLKRVHLLMKMAVKARRRKSLMWN